MQPTWGALPLWFGPKGYTVWENPHERLWILTGLLEFVSVNIMSRSIMLKRKQTVYRKEAQRRVYIKPKVSMVVSSAPRTTCVTKASKGRYPESSA